MSQSVLDTAEDARVGRILGFVVDFILLSVITVAIWFGFSIVQLLVGVSGMAAAGSMESQAAMTGVSIVGIVVSLAMWAVIGLVLLAYFVYFQTNGGQTLGMKLTDVAVVGSDGSALTRGHALKRTAVLLAPFPVMALVTVFLPIPVINFLIALALMVGWLLVEAVVMFVDDDARRLGDRFAGTAVVEAN